MTKSARKPRKLLPPLESAEEFCDRIEREMPALGDDDNVLRNWFIVQLLARDAAIRAHALAEIQP